ncbi:MAG: DUF6183 family protein [Acidimicrobiia bacterium]|nr:DUF6183 family protein [Acidimicrobiia bacterium]MDX2468593.1 DUF6183 family protein [Acidimicrobiia bacterium]
MEDVATLVEGSDLDGLIRRIDGFVSNRDWDDLIDLRDRCLEAVDRGKQLWGVAQFAEYRIALDSPAVHAGRMVREGAGRFALGPLWEVAASTHEWDEIAPHVEDDRIRTLIAHERVLRGDTVPLSDTDPHVLEVPLAIQPWEPAYAVAAYRSDRADFPEFDATGLDWIELPEPLKREAEDDAIESLLDLVQPWTEQSDGRAEGVVVAGSALEAIRTLGPHRVRAAEIDAAEALALMAWTGASGGAYGRRRGSPIGRMQAWWTLAALLGFDDIDETDELGAEASKLRWLRWDPGDQIGGWGFHLAIEDPGDGLAWAVSAVDAL